jgi:DNA-binding FadR family transcriptional regulator
MAVVPYQNLTKAKAYHNLDQMVKVIRSALISSRKVTTQIPARSQDVLPLHRAVLDAIPDHQSETACDTMRYLITRARTGINLILGQNGFQKYREGLPCQLHRICCVN